MDYYSGSFTGMGLPMMYVRLGSRITGALAEGMGDAAHRLAARKKLRKQIHAVIDTLPPRYRQRAVKNTVQALAEQGYAFGTIIKYVHYVEDFDNWRGNGTDTPPSKSEVEHYIKELATAGYGTGVQRLALSALRAVLDRICKLDVTEGMHHAPRPCPRTPAGTKDIYALYDACKDRTDTTLLLLLNVLKLRPGQIASLRWQDVDLESRLLHYSQGRSDRMKWLAIPAAAAKQLSLLRQEHTKSAFIFPSGRDPSKPITVRGLQKKIEKLCSQTGVQTNCTAVRRTRAVFAEADGRRDDLQREIGVFDFAVLLGTLQKRGFQNSRNITSDGRPPLKPGLLEYETECKPEHTVSLSHPASCPASIHIPAQPSCEVRHGKPRNRPAKDPPPGS